jgi:DNA-binding beta-propeller fold protein YncE
MNPFALIATDPEHMLILDQGLKRVVRYSEGELDVPRSFRSQDMLFPSMVDACPLTDGTWLFTDSHLNRIFRSDNRTIEVLNDTLELLQPTGIAVNSSREEIWVVETGAHSVSVLDREGRRLKRIGGRGFEPGRFNYPTFIWIDRDGKVYIVDSMNFRIQIFTEDGELLTWFGEHGDASGNLARPKGIATDSHGHIYVADALFHAVQVFDRTGNLLHYFGGQGHERGEFWLPTGIFVDENDYIYVADSYNARIQVFHNEMVQER